MIHTYTVTGMTCNGCKASVEKHLNALPNVKNALVDLDSAQATIEMSEPVSRKELQEALPKNYLISKKPVQNGSKTSELEEQKSDLQQLKPLFLIFGYITVASILISYKNWDWSSFMLDFMGLFYIVFSFFKILDLKGFRESFKMYDPLAKAIPAYAKVYPFIELVLGLLFLMRLQIPLALIVTIVILGMTTFGVSKTLLSKQSMQCACLGTSLKLPMTKATFIENTIMIIMAILMLLKTFSL